MALSSEELTRINSRGLAVSGKRYYGDNEKIYVGTSNGRLRQLDKAEISPFTPVVGIVDNNVQAAIETVNNRLLQTCKQVEIDFGSSLYQVQKIFNIVDSDVSQGNKILASLAYEIPTGKSLDELEMDEIVLKCKANSGSLDILATSLTGSVYGAFKINYQINY